MMRSDFTELLERPARAAEVATYVVFIGQGLAVSTWASRVPQVRQHLQLDPAQLGMALSLVAVSGLIALPLSGPLVERVGSRHAVAAFSGLMAAGLVLVVAGYLHGAVPLSVGLFLLGFATGGWDVAMTVHAAAVEHRLNRPLMSRFYAGFSIGSVGGALLGTAAVALGVPVPVHLTAIAVLVAGAVPPATRRFLVDEPGAESRASSGQVGRARSAWIEGRTLLVGLLALTFAVAEGAGTGWIALSVIDDRHAPAAFGTGALTLFLVAMTTGRWLGPVLLRRWTRVMVLRSSAATALAGLLLFVLAPGAGGVVSGTVMWGLGASLGFPLAMSAAADDPARAASRVSAVASIGYIGFLSGPALIGGIASHTTIAHALFAAVAALLVAVAVAGASAPTGPLEPTEVPDVTDVTAPRHPPMEE